MSAARKSRYDDPSRLPGTLSDEEYLRAMRKKLAAGRVPYTGTIEITHRCNLLCIHCYLGDQRAIARERRRELSARAWRRVLDEAAAAGCMELLITGGEPLLRKDFGDIYRHAREAGYIVTVFTNATRVTDAVVELFADLPPFLVEVSLYGATAGTHDGITQVRGSFDRCLAGVERLLEGGVSVGLKTS